MKTPPTHIDRTYSNKKVIEMGGNMQTRKSNSSQTYGKKKLKLFGHVLRADCEDPMKEITFDPITSEPKGLSNKRKGKPKLNWPEEGFR